jgi:hypothetical protein
MVIVSPSLTSTLPIAPADCQGRRSQKATRRAGAAQVGRTKTAAGLRNQGPLLRTFVLTAIPIVNRLPNEFTQLHPEVIWRSIKGARTVTSDDYHRIDPRVIGESLNRDLPELGRLLGLQVRPDDAVGGVDDQ